MTVERGHASDGRLYVKVMHDGITLRDYTYSRETVQAVQDRLVSLALRLATDKPRQ